MTDFWIDFATQYIHGKTPDKWGGVRFYIPVMTQVAAHLWVGGVWEGLLLPQRFQHVVSLYPWESYAVFHRPKTQLSVHMHDREDEDLGLVDTIAEWVNNRRLSGEDVLVHCQAGLNRSALVAARALMRPPLCLCAEVAIETIRRKRHHAVLCNPGFEKWLRAHD